MGDAEPRSPLPLEGTQQALVEAAGRCLARWGVSKTTVADLATEAGCSRATVYRVFPGGKNQIMALYGLSELQLFFDDASQRAAASATLRDALVDVITTAARGLAEHTGFQFMLTHEPGLVLPYLGFRDIDRLYLLAADALGPAFERFAPRDARRVIELATRITLSYTFQPSSTVDLCDVADVRRIVDTHLMPTRAARTVDTPTAPADSATAPLPETHPPAPLAVPA